MTVRITPRNYPVQTVLYGGVTSVYSDGERLRLTFGPEVVAGGRRDSTSIDLRKVAEIALDELPGDFF